MRKANDYCLKGQGTVHIMRLRFEENFKCGFYLRNYEEIGILYKMDSYGTVRNVHASPTTFQCDNCIYKNRSR